MSDSGKPNRLKPTLSGYSWQHFRLAAGGSSAGHAVSETVTWASGIDLFLLNSWAVARERSQISFFLMPVNVILQLMVILFSRSLALDSR